ncbi:cell division protein SepF [Ligilactobacillus ceti]|uniref:Cell division protein SepF n=1 Tax=Ligilactobacillus ceti DSM 22408 TaxID=1122146 RepID=A0A0R2KPX3_9LACO|nr:cell division protein SepF [Ligilactobacillus ceti]KRN88956.1 hypothetical protein IV53_GL000926 [Ligilactobacillus ceti DSM 22408]
MSFSEKINNWFGSYPEEDEISNEQPPVKTNSKQVMSLVNSKQTTQINEKKIMLFEPRVFSDVKTMAGRLLNDQAVVVNFQRMSEEQAYRVVDFLSGVIFAIDGDMQRIGEQIFLCTPHDYVVEGSLTNATRSQFEQGEF